VLAVEEKAASACGGSTARPGERGRQCAAFRALLTGGFGHKLLFFLSFRPNLHSLLRISGGPATRCVFLAQLSLLDAEQNGSGATA
jgi:hypothetical protein